MGADPRAGRVEVADARCVIDVWPAARCTQYPEMRSRRKERAERCSAQLPGLSATVAPHAAGFLRSILAYISHVRVIPSSSSEFFSLAALQC